MGKTARSDPMEWLRDGTRVNAFNGHGFGIHATGKVIAYTDRPTVVIEADDGTRTTWIADLCEPVKELTTKELLIGFHITRDRLQSIPEPKFSERMELRSVLAIIDELENDTRDVES